MSIKTRKFNKHNIKRLHYICNPLTGIVGPSVKKEEQIRNRGDKNARAPKGLTGPRMTLFRTARKHGNAFGLLRRHR
jgi:3-deoxy-D-arabino-heptulosonate 7-phosphate (DAHP) synthase class II